jgi:UDP-2-acetamido-3-amino-2,3-dideoxy-glucuronate N-acetyltransferase
MRSVIGDDCNIGQNVFIGPGVKLGNRVKVQNNVSIYAGVVCEDDVFLGPSCVFTNVLYPRSFVDRKQQFHQTTVKRGATIGANATIVCGNEIGSFSLVGAGAVVTKNVAPHALVTGNPAVQVGWVSEQGRPLSFDENGTAVCPESGQQYRLHNNLVNRLENEQ